MPLHILTPTNLGNLALPVLLYNYECVILYESFSCSLRLNSVCGKRKLEIAERKQQQNREQKFSLV